MPSQIESVLRSVSVGEAQVFQNLAVFPLLSDTAVEPDYVPLAEALRSGQTKVTEVSSAGAVPELLLDNSSPKRVLLLDGDELVGAKQNRVLNVTILVAANQKLKIPVSCVERGRWHAASSEFRSEDRMMFAKARAAKMAQVSQSMRTGGTRRSDQGAVWDSVGAKVRLFQVGSRTEAMSDVYQHVGGDARDYRDAFRAGPRQVGGIFVVDGKPAGLELFDAPATFAATLGRLVESYALDAIERPRGARMASVPARKAATEMISRICEAKIECAKAVGEGEDLRLESPGIVGEALVVNERVVHLSALAHGGDGEPGGRRGRGERVGTGRRGS
jgi:hypothetical protein